MNMPSRQAVPAMYCTGSTSPLLPLPSEPAVKPVLANRRSIYPPVQWNWHAIFSAIWPVKPYYLWEPAKWRNWQPDISRGNGCTDILVANRTLKRAQSLALEFEGHALTMDQLPDYLDAADIVLSSTGASTFVLLPDAVEAAMKKRRGKPMFLVDIAVPRDIDPRISDIDGAYLYDIDDLQQVVQGNVEHREQEAQLAGNIIDEESVQFQRWLKSLESVPLIRSIQQQMEARRSEEMEKALRYMKGFDANQIEAVERFSKALMKRYMHPTLSTLKKLPDDIEGDLLMGAATRLFDIESPMNEPVMLNTSTKGNNEHSSG